MNFQEINNLADDPASVSWSIKLLALGLLLGFILFVGYRVLIVDSIDQLDTIKSKENELKAVLETRQRRASQLAEYETQLEEMQRSFGALIQQLPSSTEIPALILDISEKGVSNGLEIELFEPTNEVEKEFYAEKPIKITALGTYQQLAKFVSDISGLPRIVTIHDIMLRPEDQDGNKNNKTAKTPHSINPQAESESKRRLRMDAVIKTYRYLDEHKEKGNVAKTNNKDNKKP